MKKFLYTLFSAAAVLLCAACQQEQKLDIADDNVVDVTFAVGVGDMQTKAFGDGKQVDFLHVLVYSKGDDGTLTHLPKVSQEISDAFKENLQQSVTLKLVKGMSYNIVFWAQKAGCEAYTVDKEKGTLTLDPEKLVANDDALDAFYAVLDDFTPQGALTSVQLKRPFAQVNLLSKPADYQAALDNGLTLAAENALASKVTVKAPTVLTLTKGDASEPKEITYAAHVIAPVVVGTSTAPTGYQIAMAYLLAGEKSELESVKFEVYYKNQLVDKAIEIENVPFQRNYRTQIIGSVFTTDNAFDVKLVPDTEDEISFYPGAATQTVPAASVAALEALEGVSATVDAETGAVSVTVEPETENIDLENFKSDAGLKPESLKSSDETVVKVDADSPLKLVVVGTGEAEVTVHYNAYIDEKEITKSGDPQDYNATDVVITVKVGYDFETIADLNKLVTSTSKEFSGYLKDAVVSFVPATNQAIIKDATGSVFLYKSKHGLKQGQTYTGKITVTAVLYNSLYSEITSHNATFTGDEAVVDPEEVALKDLIGKYDIYQNAYVKVSGLEVTNVNGKNITVTDGENTYVVFCNFGNATNTVGQVITAIGTVTKYQTTEEIKVWKEADIEIEEEEPAVDENDGTVEHPYTVAEVREYIDALNGGTSENVVYVKGVVVKLTDYNFAASSQTASFFIADSKESSDTFEAYKVAYLNKEKFVDGDKGVAEGDEVIVAGKVKVYNSSTYETTGDSDSFLYSLNGKTLADPVILAKDITDIAAAGVSGAKISPAYAHYAGWDVVVKGDGTIVTDTSAADGEVTYSVSPNTAAEARNGSITITMTKDGENEKTKTVKVFQLAAGTAVDYAKVYESNITLSTPSGSNASAAKVVISDVQYDAIKVGTAKNSGYMELIVPEGKTKLHIHAVVWKNESGKLFVKKGETSLLEAELNSDDGISGNSPFTLQTGTPEDLYYTIEELPEHTENLSLTVTCTNNRFVIWGVNAE